MQDCASLAHGFDVRLAAVIVRFQHCAGSLLSACSQPHGRNCMEIADQSGRLNAIRHCVVETGWDYVGNRQVQVE